MRKTLLINHQQLELNGQSMPTNRGKKEITNKKTKGTKTKGTSNNINIATIDINKTGPSAKEDTGRMTGRDLTSRDSLDQNCDSEKRTMHRSNERKNITYFNSGSKNQENPMTKQRDAEYVYGESKNLNKDFASEVHNVQKSNHNHPPPIN